MHKYILCKVLMQVYPNIFPLISPSYIIREKVSLLNYDTRQNQNQNQVGQNLISKYQVRFFHNTEAK